MGGGLSRVAGEEFLIACREGDVRLVKKKLKRNKYRLAVKYGRIRDETQRSPLHLACNFKNTNDDEIINLLVGVGADVNAKSLSDITPLHVAAFHNNANAVRLLLSKGADPNAPNKGGRRPTDVAKSMDVKRILLEATEASGLARTSSQASSTYSVVPGAHSNNGNSGGSASRYQSLTRHSTVSSIGSVGSSDERERKRLSWRKRPTQGRSAGIPWQELEVWELVGTGSYKQVYTGTWEGMEVALLRIRDTDAASVQDVRTMQAVDKHEHIVSLLGVCQDDPDESVGFWMVVELLPFGSVEDVFHRNEGHKFDAVGKVMILSQLSDALDAMHSVRPPIVHRDLACRNVLVSCFDPPSIKLADFGLSRFVDKGALREDPREAVFPLRWSAPEAILDGIWTTKSDVWSFGVVVWELYSDGEVPYGLETTEEEVKNRICSGDTLEKPEGCPVKIWSLVEMCWQFEAVRRPTFRQLQEKIDMILSSVIGQT